MSYLALMLILLSYDKPAPIPAAPAQVARGWPYRDEGIGGA